MPIGKVLKNFNLLINGGPYAGRVEELTLPKLTLKTEEFRGGGMDMPIEIDMGMEKMECDFTLIDYDTEVLKFFGLAPDGFSATSNGNRTPEPGTVTLNFMGVEQDQTNGQVNSIKIVVDGIWKEVDMGPWKAGEKATMKVQVACRYYEYIANKETIIKIDIDNMIRQIGNDDQLQKIREGLGGLTKPGTGTGATQTATT